jgi:hypothetical protein
MAERNSIPALLAFPIFTGVVLCLAALGCNDMGDESVLLETEVPAVTEQALDGRAANPGPNEAIVCPDANYYGNCVRVPVGLFPNSAGVGNDSMSSAKVGSNVRLSLCTDGGFGSLCQTLGPNARVTHMDSVGDFMNGHHGFNDQVSSMRLEVSSKPDCRDLNPPQGWVYLTRYSASWYNFTFKTVWIGQNGIMDCVAVPYDTNNRTPTIVDNVIDVGFANDALYRIVMPSNSHVVLYNDQNRGGANVHLYAASQRRELWLSDIGWANRVTSLTISRL